VPLPDAADLGSGLDAKLRSLSRRVLTRDVLCSLAVAVPAGSVTAGAMMRGGFRAAAAAALALILTAAGSAIWLSRRRVRWTGAAAAREIERTSPSFRNVVITAEELSRHPDRARPSIRTRVLADAARSTEGVAAAEIVPVRLAVITAAAGLVLGPLVLTNLPERAAGTLRQVVQQAVGGSSPGQKGGLKLVATIVPPTYTRQPSRTISEPDRIDGLQGSQLRLVLQDSKGTGWRVRFGNDVLDSVPSNDGAVIDFALSQSGYLAIESDDTNSAGSRRLLPVSVTPDRAPTIRVEAPGKDLLLPDVRPVVSVTASASDDFGLQSLELRYTKASGSGEQFEFKEGSIPLAITRDSERAWNARANVAVSTLGLEPGDVLVYRLVAHDSRPGDAGLATSDTFFIEVAGPGQVALAGFELPPDHERYALSQQMIVLKIERLRAREQTLSRSALVEETANIAAEQRAVRGNFVFLMGGHVEDEEVEAEHSNEIQEGRLQNTARQEINAAIQHMGRAEQALVAVSTGAALPPARAAVQALQRAFGSNRYILRTLPVRSRVDPSRRLSGELSSASDWRRELQTAGLDHRTRAARDLLVRLLDVSQSMRSAPLEPELLTALAEQALAVDPTAEEWQAISKRLLRLRDAAGSDPAESKTLLNQALAVVVAEAQRGAATPVLVESGDEALRSAWAEEHRRQ
jgi:hypothetical protein